MLRATPPSAVHRAVLHWAVLHCAVPDCLVLDRPACRHPPRRAEECHINFFEKMDLPSLSPAQARAVAAIRAELARLVRYDDESVVHDRWVRQRYDGYYAVSYLPARSAPPASTTPPTVRAGSTASRSGVTSPSWSTPRASSPNACATGACPPTT